MKLYIINKGSLVAVKKPILSMGDVYIIVTKRIIYIWIGSKSTVDEKTSAAAIAHNLYKERKGEPKIVTIDEKEEPKEFIKLINSKMGSIIVVKANYAKTLLKDVDTSEFADYTEWKNILYRVSSEEFENIEEMYLIQVPFRRESLSSEDCFIADLGIDIYVWYGKDSNVKERFKAGQWAQQLDGIRTGAQNDVIFEEGNDEEFLAALDRGKDYKDLSRFAQLHPESELEK